MTNTLVSTVHDCGCVRTIAGRQTRPFVAVSKSLSVLNESYRFVLSVLISACATADVVI